MNGRTEGTMRASLHETASATQFVKDERPSCLALGGPTRSWDECCRSCCRHSLSPTDEARALAVHQRSGPRSTADIPWPAQKPTRVWLCFRAPHDQCPSTHPKCLSPAKTTGRGRRLIEADDATPNFDPTRIRSTSRTSRGSLMTLAAAVPRVREVRRPRVPLTRS